MKVIFCQGIPGSGKTTWAKAYCEKNTDWVRVSRDDLRNSRGRYWLPKDEDIIIAWEIKMIEIALAFNKNVIIDATNFNKQHVRKIKERLDADNVEFETKRFDVSLEEAIKRDLKRPNSIGADVIMRFYNKYIKKPVKPINNDPSLPHALIVDLDGTLCIHNGRSPFEYQKCDTDILNVPVAEIVKTYLHDDKTNIIYLSGREDSCKEKTIEWLTKHELYYNWSTIKVYMRKTGDFRKDCIIKKELFDEYIKNKYYIKFCLDDRSQVVKLWRSLGLTVFQVDEGEF